MSSYIYMKILESQPGRYDRGIDLLSLGAAGRFARRLVEENIRPGERVLDIGCGTGTVAVLAAGAGARVLAFDRSPGMLEVANRKIRTSGLNDRIELREMGVAGMDGLEPGSFDVACATLVFSELSPDEQDYTLGQARRVLKPGGRLALTAEVRPRTVARRFLYGLLRLPLALLTFLLTQTTTAAATGLEERVRAAGFTVRTEQRSHLDSFLYLVAVGTAAGGAG